LKPAVEWIWAHSKAPGTAKLALLAIAEISEGCIARTTFAELSRVAGISVRQSYRAVEILEELSETEKRVEEIDKKRVTRFHLLRWHAATLNTVPTRKCTHFYSKLPDLRIQIPLCAKPEISTAPKRTASGLLAGRDLEEHEWLANQMRIQLGLPVRPKEEFALRAPR
jgi:hypothetical protein